MKYALEDGDTLVGDSMTCQWEITENIHQRTVTH